MKVFKKIDGYEWGFYRLEFQDRGSVHVHGFLRICPKGMRPIDDIGQHIKGLSANLYSLEELGHLNDKEHQKAKDNAEKTIEFLCAQIIIYHDWLGIKASFPKNKDN